MKLKILLIVLFVITSGCNYWGVRGNGDFTNEIRDIEEFNELEVSGAFVVYVRVGEEPSLEIDADENLLRYIITKVRGDKLIIDSRKNLRSRRDIRVKVSTPELNEVEASGANELIVKDVRSREFRINLSGACEIEVDGETEFLDIDLSGAGYINTKDLFADEVKINLSGAASADIYVEEFLDAEVSGAGSINYFGDPDDVRSDVSGAASINRK
jgi:hypothetical protein